jgi:FlaA1/EpsC-like NDP-sugar epimerase
MFYELVTTDRKNFKNVIVFGAGSMGVLMKGVIESDGDNDYNIVAFVDNSRRLQNKSLSGIRVLSPKKLNREFLKKHEVEVMIFAIKDIPGSEKREIFKFAVDLGLQVLEVPPVNKWLNGQFELNQLKKIRVEDLLVRDPIQMNMKIIENGLRDKVILVTGAAGSIGSEIVRQLTRFRIRKLILVDNAETPMFHLENEIREHFSFAPIRTILADATDQMRMDRIFNQYRPEVVFHAAAYKHVPLMEENPVEAVRVNVGSTILLSRLAQKYRVHKFVMVSTDKAVNPTNVMGASKRICEMILTAHSQSFDNRTQFVITRFGNVLGSNGSVIPIFKKQIEEGGPVTVTHPEITRYFMTIPEASQLVLEAGFMGMGGEIFVFDMGDPVKIAQLARQMITLSGYEPDKDIQIEYTGLRPGEKLYEELLTDQEKLLPTYNAKLKVAQVDRLEPKFVLEQVHRLLHSYQLNSEEELVEKIAAIVPEFDSSNERFAQRKNGSNGQQAALVEL